MFESYRDFIDFCQPFWKEGMGLEAAFDAAVEAMISDLGATRDLAVAEAEYWIVGPDKGEW